MACLVRIASLDHSNRVTRDVTGWIAAAKVAAGELLVAGACSLRERAARAYTAVTRE